MWYPTVRRTLVCLSRLYRCLEVEIFQGLSQEVLDACIFSLESACSQITTRKGLRNGQLFMIKHLLILREQITPFQVQLSVLEHSLDFSKLKNAALSFFTEAHQVVRKISWLFSSIRSGRCSAFQSEPSDLPIRGLEEGLQEPDRLYSTSVELQVKSDPK